jgi:TonB family protein
MEWRMAALVVVIACVCGAGGAGTASAGPPGTKPDVVVPPKVIHRVNPEYSREARVNGIQGTVVLQIVIDLQGVPGNVKVLSPLGFGLDEQAVAAVKRWQFQPGRTRDGRPVAVYATAEVNFRLGGRWMDEKAERDRTAYNTAVSQLGNPARKAKAVSEIERLAKKCYAPAMYRFGMLCREGDGVERDEERAFALVQAAAEKLYGPAMYEIARMYIDGGRLGRDPEKGFRMMRDAALLGSQDAQFFLGASYERGAGIEKDPERAQRYFRLCAAGGVALCRLRLAMLLIERGERSERDYVQGLAWCELAADQGLAEAKQVLEREAARMSPEQRSGVARMKEYLGRKR